MKPFARRALVLGAGVAAACGGGWREVDERLTAASAGVRAEGYAPLAGPFNDFGAFDSSFVKDWRVTLDTGRYAIGVACVGGCAMSVQVAGTNGPVIPERSADEGVTRLHVMAAGVHTVRLAGECAAGARCRWASQVYGAGSRGLRPGFAGGER
jgi:hypothetical protein